MNSAIRETGPAAPSITVFVWDGTPLSNQLLVEALNRDSEVKAIAADGDWNTVSSQLMSMKPDIVLVGEQAPSARAVLESIRLATATVPGVNVLGLLNSASSELVAQAFRSGAKGVICREESLDVIVEAIHAVSRGHIWIGTNQLKYLVDTLHPALMPDIVNGNGEMLLTRREMEVVQGVIDGLTNREIATRLQLSEHTVKNYLFRLFDKLGVSNRAELVSYAHAHRAVTEPMSSKTA